MSCYCCDKLLSLWRVACPISCHCCDELLFVWLVACFFVRLLIWLFMWRVVIFVMKQPKEEGDGDGWHRASIEWVAYKLNRMLGMVRTKLLANLLLRVEALASDVCVISAYIVHLHRLCIDCVYSMCIISAYIVHYLHRLCIHVCVISAYIVHYLHRLCIDCA
jgi:hypothetical protein